MFILQINKGVIEKKSKKIKKKSCSLLRMESKKSIFQPVPAAAEKRTRKKTKNSVIRRDSRNDGIGNSGGILPEPEAPPGLPDAVRPFESPRRTAGAQGPDDPHPLRIPESDIPDSPSRGDTPGRRKDPDSRCRPPHLPACPHGRIQNP